MPRLSCREFLDRANRRVYVTRRQDGNSSPQRLQARSCFNQLASIASTCFTAIGSLPTVKVGAQNEEFSTDLHDPNAFFLNDSAEMPHGEPGQFGCVRYVEKHSFAGMDFGYFHGFLLVRR